MNADAFRHFYNYHLSENRIVWKHIASLAFEQFAQPVDYSRGSVRDQLLHLIDAEDIWFSELSDVKHSEQPAHSNSDDRAAIRAYWDTVEQKIRAYLSELRDDMLFAKPIKEPEEDQVLIV